MAVTLYDVTVPVFIKYIKTLKFLLSKGEANDRVSEEAIVQARLYPDMGTLIYQIQRVSDTAKGLCQRLGKIEPVELKDNEKTMADLYARLDATLAILERVKPEDVNANEDTEVVIKTREGDLKWIGKEYAQTFAVPNFFFHLVTAYGLLRMLGIDVGKSDYLGRNTPADA